MVKMEFLLWDLRLWLAINAIILLIFSEILSSHKIKILIYKENMRLAAIILGIGFMITVFIEIYETILSLTF